MNIIRALEITADNAGKYLDDNGIVDSVNTQALRIVREFLELNKNQASVIKMRDAFVGKYGHLY